MSVPDTAAAVVAARACDHEMMVLSMNPTMAGYGFNFLIQMEKRGYSNALLVSTGALACGELHAKWAPLQGPPLACAWATEVAQHRGWARYGLKATDAYVLWAARWYVSARLVDAGCSVLVLDVDGVILRDDLYRLLRSPPLGHFDAVVTAIGDGKRGVNCGFAYFNAQPLPGGSNLTAGECAADQGAAGQRDGCRRVAAWLAHAIYERIALFLELPEVIRLNGSAERRGTPASGVLWEAHVWNDVLLSVQKDADEHPWGWGMAQSTVWQRLLHYERATANDKYLGRRKARVTFTSPITPPTSTNGATFHRRVMSGLPLHYMPLCSPRRYRVFSNAMRGGGRCLASGKLLFAPPWLVGQGASPWLEWAAASPPQTAYVHVRPRASRSQDLWAHAFPCSAADPQRFTNRDPSLQLVNMWRCFGTESCYGKQSRLWWLRANGLWDWRLDSLGHTPTGIGEAYKKKTPMRLLALSPAAVHHLIAQPHAQSNTSRPFLALHVLVHNLVTAAALLNRVAVIPRVPCSFFERRFNGYTDKQSRLYPRGINLPDVFVVADKEDGNAPVGGGARCYLSPGGYGGCNADFVMPAFDFEHRMASGSNTEHRAHAATSSTTVRLHPRRGLRDAVHPSSRSATDHLERLCEQARPLADSPVVWLDGLMRPGAPHSLVDDVKTSNPSPDQYLSVLGDPEVRRRLDKACPGGVVRHTLVSKHCLFYVLRKKATAKRSMQL